MIIYMQKTLQYGFHHVWTKDESDLLQEKINDHGIVKTLNNEVYIIFPFINNNDRSSH